MVYVFLADGFEEIEALTPVDILRRGGVAVKTVGIGSDTVTGAHGIKVTSDSAPREIDLDSIEAIILPGGMPGTLNLKNSETVNAVLDYACKNGKLVCAICAAPSILGEKGLLSGKEATCFDGFEKHLHGAKLSGLPVVRDGQFITARGAGVASEFGFQILAALKNEQTAEKLKGDMKYIIR